MSLQKFLFIVFKVIQDSSMCRHIEDHLKDRMAINSIKQNTASNQRNNTKGYDVTFEGTVVTFGILLACFWKMAKISRRAGEIIIWISVEKLFDFILRMGVMGHIRIKLIWNFSKVFISLPFCCLLINLSLVHFCSSQKTNTYSTKWSRI